MNLQSLSLSFRIPLAFHSMNNEGVSGNVMEPRRITIKETEYDGISGEMVRRHVLENFVRLCIERDIPLADECRGLVPERSKSTLKKWMADNKVTELKSDDYGAATTHLLKSCALSDLGGYLLALQKAKDKVEGTLKRDSCFEFGWLITENPAIVEFTQGVAYDPDPGSNKLFTSNMRVGVYCGVFRFDLGRVGHNDWAWLAPRSEANALSDDEKKQWEEDKKKRIAAFLDALEQWLLSPGGARQAGWLPHLSDARDGIFCLSSAGPAPFVSPLSIDLSKEAEPVSPNGGYRQSLKNLATERPGRFECIEFDTLATLAGAFDSVRTKIGL